jgi:hypothetical protein
MPAACTDGLLRDSQDVGGRRGGLTGLTRNCAATVSDSSSGIGICAGAHHVSTIRIIKDMFCSYDAHTYDAHNTHAHRRVGIRS